MQFRTEFKTLIGVTSTAHTLMESWPSWCKKIIAYAHLEKKNRPKMKEALKKLDDSTCKAGGLQAGGNLINSELLIHAFYSFHIL